MAEENKAEMPQQTGNLEAGRSPEGLSSPEELRRMRDSVLEKSKRDRMQFTGDVAAGVESGFSTPEMAYNSISEKVFGGEVMKFSLEGGLLGNFEKNYGEVFDSIRNVSVYVPYFDFEGLKVRMADQIALKVNAYDGESYEDFFAELNGVVESYKDEIETIGDFDDLVDDALEMPGMQDRIEGDNLRIYLKLYLENVASVGAERFFEPLGDIYQKEYVESSDYVKNYWKMNGPIQELTLDAFASLCNGVRDLSMVEAGIQEELVVPRKVEALKAELEKAFDSDLNYEWVEKIQGFMDERGLSLNDISEKYLPEMAKLVVFKRLTPEERVAFFVTFVEKQAEGGAELDRLKKGAEIFNKYTENREVFVDAINELQKNRIGWEDQLRIARDEAEKNGEAGEWTQNVAVAEYQLALIESKLADQSFKMNVCEVQYMVAKGIVESDSFKMGDPSTEGRLKQLSDRYSFENVDGLENYLEDAGMSVMPSMIGYLRVIESQKELKKSNADILRRFAKDGEDEMTAEQWRDGAKEFLAGNEGEFTAEVREVMQDQARGLQKQLLAMQGAVEAEWANLNAAFGPGARAVGESSDPEIAEQKKSEFESRVQVLGMMMSQYDTVRTKLVGDLRYFDKMSKPQGLKAMILEETTEGNMAFELRAVDMEQQPEGKNVSVEEYLGKLATTDETFADYNRVIRDLMEGRIDKNYKPDKNLEFAEKFFAGESEVAKTLAEAEGYFEGWLIDGMLNNSGEIQRQRDRVADCVKFYENFLAQRARMIFFLGVDGIQDFSFDKVKGYDPKVDQEASTKLGKARELFKKAESYLPPKSKEAEKSFDAQESGKIVDKYLQTSANLEDGKSKFEAKFADVKVEEAIKAYKRREIDWSNPAGEAISGLNADNREMMMGNMNEYLAFLAQYIQYHNQALSLKTKLAPGMAELINSDEIEDKVEEAEERMRVLMEFMGADNVDMLKMPPEKTGNLDFNELQARKLVEPALGVVQDCYGDLAQAGSNVNRIYTQFARLGEFETTIERKAYLGAGSMTEVFAQGESAYNQLVSSVVSGRESILKQKSQLEALLKTDPEYEELRADRDKVILKTIEQLNRLLDEPDSPFSEDNVATLKSERDKFIGDKENYDWELTKSLVTTGIILAVAVGAGIAAAGAASFVAGAVGLSQGGLGAFVLSSTFVAAGSTLGQNVGTHAADWAMIQADEYLGTAMGGIEQKQLDKMWTLSEMGKTFGTNLVLAGLGAGMSRVPGALAVARGSKATDLLARGGRVGKFLAQKNLEFSRAFGKAGVKTMDAISPLLGPMNVFGKGGGNLMNNFAKQLGFRYGTELAEEGMEEAAESLTKTITSGGLLDKALGDYFETLGYKKGTKGSEFLGTMAGLMVAAVNGADGVNVDVRLSEMGASASRLGVLAESRKDGVQLTYTDQSPAEFVAKLEAELGPDLKPAGGEPGGKVAAQLEYEISGNSVRVYVTGSDGSFQDLVFTPSSRMETVVDLQRNLEGVVVDEQGMGTVVSQDAIVGLAMNGYAVVVEGGTVTAVRGKQKIELQNKSGISDADLQAYSKVSLPAASSDINDRIGLEDTQIGPNPVPVESPAPEMSDEQVVAALTQEGDSLKNFGFEEASSLADLAAKMEQAERMGLEDTQMRPNPLPIESPAQPQGKPAAIHKLEKLAEAQAKFESENTAMTPMQRDVNGNEMPVSSDKIVRSVEIAAGKSESYELGRGQLLNVKTETGQNFDLRKAQDGQGRDLVTAEFYSKDGGVKRFKLLKGESRVIDVAEFGGLKTADGQSLTGGFVRVEHNDAGSIKVENLRSDLKMESWVVNEVVINAAKSSGDQADLETAQMKILELKPGVAQVYGINEFGRGQAVEVKTQVGGKLDLRRSKDNAGQDLINVEFGAKGGGKRQLKLLKGESKIIDISEVSGLRFDQGKELTGSFVKIEHLADGSLSVESLQSDLKMSVQLKTEVAQAKPFVPAEVVGGLQVDDDTPATRVAKPAANPNETVEQQSLSKVEAAVNGPAANSDQELSFADKVERGYDQVLLKLNETMERVSKVRDFRKIEAMINVYSKFSVIPDSDFTSENYNAQAIFDQITAGVELTDGQKNLVLKKIGQWKARCDQAQMVRQWEVKPNENADVEMDKKSKVANYANEIFKSQLLAEFKDQVKLKHPNDVILHSVEGTHIVLVLNDEDAATIYTGKPYESLTEFEKNKMSQLQAFNLGLIGKNISIMTKSFYEKNKGTELETKVVAHEADHGVRAFLEAGMKQSKEAKKSFDETNPEQSIASYMARQFYAMKDEVLSHMKEKLSASEIQTALEGLYEDEMENMVAYVDGLQVSDGQKAELRMVAEKAYNHYRGQLAEIINVAQKISKQSNGEMYLNLTPVEKWGDLWKMMLTVNGDLKSLDETKGVLANLVNFAEERFKIGENYIEGGLRMAAKLGENAEQSEGENKIEIPKLANTKSDGELFSSPDGESWGIENPKAAMDKVYQLINSGQRVIFSLPYDQNQLDELLETGKLNQKYATIGVAPIGHAEDGRFYVVLRNDDLSFLTRMRPIFGQSPNEGSSKDVFGGVLGVNGSNGLNLRHIGFDVVDSKTGKVITNSEDLAALDYEREMDKMFVGGPMNDSGDDPNVLKLAEEGGLYENGDSDFENLLNSVEAGVAEQIGSGPDVAVVDDLSPSADVESIPFEGPGAEVDNDEAYADTDAAPPQNPIKKEFETRAGVEELRLQKEARDNAEYQEKMKPVWKEVESLMEAGKAITISLPRIEAELVKIALVGGFYVETLPITLAGEPVTSDDPNGRFYLEISDFDLATKYFSPKVDDKGVFTGEMIINSRAFLPAVVDGKSVFKVMDSKTGQEVNLEQFQDRFTDLNNKNTANLSEEDLQKAFNAYSAEKGNEGVNIDKYKETNLYAQVRDIFNQRQKDIYKTAVDVSNNTNEVGKTLADGYLPIFSINKKWFAEEKMRQDKWIKDEESRRQEAELKGEPFEERPFAEGEVMGFYYVANEGGEQATIGRLPKSLDQRVGMKLLAVPVGPKGRKFIEKHIYGVGGRSADGSMEVAVDQFNIPGDSLLVFEVTGEGDQRQAKLVSSLPGYENATLDLNTGRLSINSPEAENEQPYDMKYAKPPEVRTPEQSEEDFVKSDYGALFEAIKTGNEGKFVSLVVNLKGLTFDMKRELVTSFIKENDLPQSSMLPMTINGNMAFFNNLYKAVANKSVVSDQVRNYLRLFADLNYDEDIGKLAGSVLDGGGEFFESVIIGGNKSREERIMYLNLYRFANPGSPVDAFFFNNNTFGFLRNGDKAAYQKALNGYFGVNIPEFNGNIEEYSQALEEVVSPDIAKDIVFFLGIFNGVNSAPSMIALKSSALDTPKLKSEQDSGPMPNPLKREASKVGQNDKTPVVGIGKQEAKSLDDGDVELAPTVIPGFVPEGRGDTAAKFGVVDTLKKIFGKKTEQPANAQSEVTVRGPSNSVREAPKIEIKPRAAISENRAQVEQPLSDADREQRLNRNPEEKEYSEVPRPTEVVAIGDTHGNLEATVNNLKQAKLINENGDWIGGNKRVVLVGDILADRNQGSLEIVKLIAKLRQQSESAGGLVDVLAGNHEDFALSWLMRMNAAQNASPEGLMLINGQGRGIFEFMKYLPGAENMNSYEFLMAQRNGNDVVKAMRQDPEGRLILEQLCQFKIAQQIDDTLFVHTNMTPAMVQWVTQWGIDNINNHYQKVLRDSLFNDGKNTSPEDLRIFVDIQNVFLDTGGSKSEVTGYDSRKDFTDEDSAKALKKIGINAIVHGHNGGGGNPEKNPTVGGVSIVDADFSAGKSGGIDERVSVGSIGRDGAITAGVPVGVNQQGDLKSEFEVRPAAVSRPAEVKVSEPARGQVLPPVASAPVSSSSDIDYIPAKSPKVDIKPRQDIPASSPSANTDIQRDPKTTIIRGNSPAAKPTSWDDFRNSVASPPASSSSQIDYVPAAKSSNVDIQPRQNIPASSPSAKADIQRDPKTTIIRGNSPAANQTSWDDFRNSVAAKSPKVDIKPRQDIQRDPETTIIRGNPPAASAPASSLKVDIKPRQDAPENKVQAMQWSSVEANSAETFVINNREALLNFGNESVVVTESNGKLNLQLPDDEYGPRGDVSIVVGSQREVNIGGSLVQINYLSNGKIKIATDRGVKVLGVQQIEKPRKVVFDTTNNISFIPAEGRGDRAAKFGDISKAQPLAPAKPGEVIELGGFGGAVGSAELIDNRGKGLAPANTDQFKEVPLGELWDAMNNVEDTLMAPTAQVDGSSEVILERGNVVPKLEDQGAIDIGDDDIDVGDDQFIKNRQDEVEAPMAVNAPDGLDGQGISSKPVKVGELRKNKESQDAEKKGPKMVGGEVVIDGQLRAELDALPEQSVIVGGFLEPGNKMKIDLYDREDEEKEKDAVHKVKLKAGEDKLTVRMIDGGVRIVYGDQSVVIPEGAIAKLDGVIYDFTGQSLIVGNLEKTDLKLRKIEKKD